MSELAVDGIPVAVTCRVLKLARQPYYRWVANPITTAEYPTRARRPANSRLDSALLSGVFGRAPGDWRKSLSRVMDQIAN